MSNVNLDFSSQSENEAAPAAMADVSASARPRRAIVIDDDEFVAGALSRQLPGLGFAEVAVSGNGLEAARLLNEPNQLDLIICDLCLPGADGVQLMRLIAARHPRTPLILISSRERRLLRAAEELARARGVRLLGSIEKPISNAALKALIDRQQTNATSEPRAAQEATVGADELRWAITQDEIIIHVQPILETASGKLAGAEVLARWLSPRRGLVPPAAFVPLAERSGLIEDMTGRVIAKALGAAGDWKRAGLETLVSVNVPLSYAQRFSLPDTIGAELARSGIRVEQFGLEITDSCLAEDPLCALDVMTRLRLRGLNLSLDDFGCGASSLNRLHQFPFNEVKIDRSFVAAALVDDEVRNIIEAVIGLAHRIGLRVVAKGVETQAHWDLLAELGCDLMQGNHIAAPFPAAQLPARLEQFLGGGARAA